MKTKTIIIVLIAFIGCIMLAQDAPRGFRNPADVGAMTSRTTSSGSGSTLTNGLVAYWTFDSAQSVTNDAFSTNNLSPVASAHTNIGVGIITNAYTNVASSGQYLNIPGAASQNLNLTTNFTVSFWAFLTDSGGDHRYVNRWGITGNLRQWYIAYNTTPDKFQFSVSTNGTTTSYTLQNNTSISLSTWYHIVAVVSNQIPYLYVNLIGTNDATAYAITNCASPFSIGGIDSSATYIRGRIDEVGVWNVVLTPSQITNLYISGTNGIGYPWTGY